MSPSRTSTRVTVLDTLGVRVLRRCASVCPDKNELPAGGGGTVSADGLSSGAARFCAVAAGAASGLAFVSVFGAAWAAGAGGLAGNCATDPSRLHDARIAKERVRVTSGMQDMMLDPLVKVVIARP
jgi:hypothetical protein